MSVFCIGVRMRVSLFQCKNNFEHLLNGQLADINVENRAKRKYPREKSPTLTKERNLFSNAHIYLIQLLDFTV